MTGKAVQWSGGRLSAVIDTAVDGVIIFDSDGRIQTFNPACERMFGYTADEVVGENVDMLMPASGGAGRDGIFHAYRRAGRRKVAGIDREAVGQRKDGSTFPMELSVGEGVQDEEHFFVGIVRDITERKAAEAELRESELRVRAVIDTAVDGVIIIDERGRIQTFNRACERLFGYAADEVIGENVKVLMPSPYREEHDRYIGNYQRTGERKIIGIGREVTGQRRDRSIFPMELSVGETIRGGHPVYVGIIRDITERKSAERAIARSVDELAAFAYSVAHDLKAPLRAMDGFAHALGEDYDDVLDANAKQYLTHIVDAASRMGEMIDDLLEYSRIGRNNATFSDLSVPALCGEVIDALAAEIEESGAQISIDGTWADIPGNRPTLFSVFQNLIGNALKFIPPGSTPRITVLGKATADCLQVDVVDNGIGVEEDCREKIFRIFHRLHDRSVYPGTGIGLAMVRKGVQLHHGTVDVTSEVGKGSTFSVVLPRRRPEAADGREGMGGQS